MDVKQIPISEVIPYARNPRINDGAVSAVAASIKEFGFQQPLVLDKDKTIVVGHTRFKAAQQLELETVPCIVAEQLTEQQIKAYRILDNKLSEKATWDHELLELELEELPEFDFEEFEVEFGTLTAMDETNTVDDEMPEPPEEPFCQFGETWHLGRHRVLCGNSADIETLETLLEGNRPCLVFTDPPYGVAIGAKNRFLNSFQAGRNLTDIESDELSPEKLKETLLPIFANVRALMAEDCTVFVCAPQRGELGMMMMMMMQESGLRPRHILIWKKNQPTFSMGRLDYDYQHEPILLTWGKRHKRPMLGQHKTSVWEVDRERACAEHPTIKPVALPINAILNHSDVGDAVLDPFLGSGTTLIAAERTGRTCYGVEIAPRYLDVICQRFYNETGTTPKRSDGLDFPVSNGDGQSAS